MYSLTFTYNCGSCLTDGFWIRNSSRLTFSHNEMRRASRHWGEPRLKRGQSGPSAPTRHPTSQWGHPGTRDSIGFFLFHENVTWPLTWRINVVRNLAVFWVLKFWVTPMSSMTNMTISLGRTAKASIGKFVDVLQHMQGFEVKPNRARPKWRTRVLIFYTKHRLFSALRHVLSLMVSPFASVNKGACIEANPSTHVGFPIVVGRMDNLLSCTNGAPLQRGA